MGDAYDEMPQLETEAEADMGDVYDEMPQLETEAEADMESTGKTDNTDGALGKA